MIHDFSRQSELFDQSTFTKPVNIIGIGATGSWLAMYLAKLGINNIHIWDFDNVEEHNVPNQYFGENHIGQNKALAMADLIQANTGVEVFASPDKFERARLDGYVFLMVDSMAERKRIWNQAIKYKTSIPLLIEPRMGLELGRVYSVEPFNNNHIQSYEREFYSDDDAEVSACGASMTVVTTAAIVASLCAKQLINHANGTEELENEIIVDLKYNQFINSKW